MLILIKDGLNRADDTEQKLKFSIRISSVNVTKSAVVTFTEEILNGKKTFFHSEFGMTKDGEAYLILQVFFL